MKYIAANRKSETQHSDSQSALEIVPADDPMTENQNSVDKHNFAENNTEVASTYKIFRMTRFLQTNHFDQNLTFDLPDLVMRNILRDMHAGVNILMLSKYHGRAYQGRAIWNHFACAVQRL